MRMILLASAGALAMAACAQDSFDAVEGRLSVSRLEIDFGHIPVGTEVRETVELLARGGRDVVVSSLAVEEPGDVFYAERDGLTVAANGSVHVAVAFAPGAAGTYQDTLTIRHDGAGLQELRVALRGSAFQPCQDEDQDTYGAFCDAGPDCDDGDPLRNPGLDEACNGYDDNCDGTVDEGCCPAGQTRNQSGACCAAIPNLPCQHTCRVDMLAGTHDCAVPGVTVDSLSTQYGRLDIEMDPDGSPADGATYAALLLTFEVCDPTGYTLALADSPTCNGHAGDGSSSSNDAEFHLGTSSTNGTTLAAYGNDYSPAGERVLLTHDDFVPATGCTTRTLWVSDQVIRSEEACFDVDSPFTQRIYPPADDEGTIDATWYIGLNKVVSGTARTGTGLQWLDLCLQ